jgi:PhzF family phenazine biosynthesis protein
MPHPITVVDAFTDTPFSGNSAAVCILPIPREDGWMQAVAREMNHANTAFVLRGGGGWRLRWFTPVVEVDLCGHATLASAHVLWEHGHAGRGEALAFETRSGRLGATLEDGWITLDMPAMPPVAVPPPPELDAAIGASFVRTYHTPFDWLIELETEAAVRSLAPDLERIKRLGRRGVIVTSEAAGEPYHFVSRFFAPAIGLPEDPVTGSAHCALGPFWAGRLKRQELLAHQASQRGGTLKISLRGDRVGLGGRAVTTVRGELLA